MGFPHRGFEEMQGFAIVFETPRVCAMISSEIGMLSDVWLSEWVAETGGLSGEGRWG